MASIPTGRTEPRDKQNIYTYLAVIAVASGLGEVFILLYAGNFGAFAKNIAGAAALTLVALAALSVGAFSGFLFGIPRRLQEAGGTASTPPATDERPERSDRSDRSRYSGNTNLEQISDWLTKIIVGIGLVQLRSILDFLGTLGKGLAASLERPEAEGPIYIVIIVYFFICGFLIGYLWARLDLGRALDQAERFDEIKEELDLVKQQIGQNVSAINLAQRQLGDNVSQRPTQDALNEAIAAATDEIKAYIFYWAQNLRSSNWRDKKGLMERTIKIFRALISSDPEQNFHRNYAQLAYALKDQRSEQWKEAEQMFSKAIDIRGNDTGYQAYEANRSICNIRLDPNYREEKPSEQEIKKVIISDLLVASGDYWTNEWISAEETITHWMKVNKLTWKSMSAFHQ